MPEQSVGMTTGTGDGTVGGYVNTRMTAKDLIQTGAGIFGDMPSVTGTGTSTLTITACDINTNGYFYQNTSNLTINVSTVSPGTYNLVCRVNDTGSAATVIRSASGTTIPLRSVRLCLVTTIPFLDEDVYLTTVTVSGGNISFIGTVTGGYAVSNSAAKSFRSVLQKSTTQTITNANTATIITWDSLSAGSSGNFSVTAPDTITVHGAGTYMLTGYIEYPSGSTGVRMISDASLGILGSNLLSSIISVPSSNPIRQHFNFVYAQVSTSTITIQVTSSVAGETITAGRLQIVRL